MRSILAGLIILASTAGNGAELKLRAGVPEGLPGYAMGPEGTLIIESPVKKRIFQCIEKTLNARFVWQALPTNRVMQMVIDDRLDLAFPMGFTNERAGKMRQSLPAWDNPDIWLSMRPVDINDKALRIAARLGSPQYADYLAEGYSKVAGSFTYKELARTLAEGLADVVIVPQSVYQDTKDDWPRETRVTVGRARSSGFYLNAADPQGLIGPLNSAIERCRGANKQGASAKP